jgi:hypothetical protein
MLLNDLGGRKRGSSMRWTIFLLVPVILLAKPTLAYNACQTSGPPWLNEHETGVLADGANFTDDAGANFVAKVFSAVYPMQVKTTIVSVTK